VAKKSSNDPKILKLQMDLDAATAEARRMRSLLESRNRRIDVLRARVIAVARDGICRRCASAALRR
jgi:hypothetical protein